MPKHFHIRWESFYKSHKIIGLVGIGLLFVYLILTAAWEPFRNVFFRGLYMLLGFMKNGAMDYALVPIYINWIATDYFQERSSTSYGNAATNGFMGLWVCMEWVRTSYSIYQGDPNLPLFIGKITISLLMLIYAAFVIKESIARKKIAHLLGRVREISFFAIMITPVIYNVVPLDILTILAIIILLPMFYGVADFVEYTILPGPAAEKKEED